MAEPDQTFIDTILDGLKEVSDKVNRRIDRLEERQVRDFTAETVKVALSPELDRLQKRIDALEDAVARLWSRDKP